MYDETTGEVVQHRGGPLKRVGKPPCRYPGKRSGETGCPKGTPENSNELTPRNLRAYLFYRECRAVGEFPDDAIVRRDAALISGVERAIAFANSEMTNQLIRQMAIRWPR